MKIVVYNLGCKVNQYECDSLVAALRHKGYEVSESLEPADAYILNTCAVTNTAEHKSRQCVTRCLSLNGDAKIVVCGCASQNNPEQFMKKDGVTYVSGVANKASIVDKLEEEGIFVSDLPTVYEDDFSTEVERTRAYVKIQDGCNNFCSYCLIPYLRGRSRSRSIKSVVEECKELAEHCSEIVLTGIDISSYGKDINTTFAALLHELKDLNCRIRLGSLEVNIVSDEFLSACNELKAFCPQFHLSLQSGCDEVLKRMNRKYKTIEYYEKVLLIRKYFKDANITTDIICGFPNETEEYFNTTCEFVKKVMFGQVHVFNYSVRQGTVAARMKQIPNEIVKPRCHTLHQIAEDVRTEYLEKFIGKEVEILIEEEENGYMAGYTREYIRAYVKNAKPNSIVLVKGVKVENNILICE